MCLSYEIGKKPVEITSDMVRRLAREVGGSTNSQAADVEDGYQRLLNGEDIDTVIRDIRAENED